jgi:tetratricopeptide (TPR) repeat protein
MKNKIDIDDLDYLANAGYSAVPDAVLMEGMVRKRLRRRISPGKWRWWLPLGILAALLVVWPKPNEKTASKPLPTTATKRLQLKEQEFSLPLILVVGEKFIRPTPTPSSPASPAFDTQEVILLEQQIATPINHEELKAPPPADNFIFIRDLKITEYGLLYFQYSREVELSGLPASSSGRRIVIKENEVKLYDILDDALKYFKEGDYAAAMVQFRQLKAYNANDLNSQFYLGMCAYHRGWYAQAMTYLTVCVETLNPAFKDEAAYYLALCTLKSGDATNGLQQLETISRSTSFYKQRASDFLKEHAN